MVYKRFIVFAVIFLALGTNLLAQSKEAISEIDKLRVKMHEIVANSDLVLLSEFYTNNAVVNGYDTQISGKEDIKSYWDNLRGQGVSWKWEKLSYSGNDNYVTQTGISFLKLRYGVEIQTYKTQFSVIWEKQKDNSYKIISDFYRQIE